MHLTIAIPWLLSPTINKLSLVFILKISIAFDGNMIVPDSDILVMPKKYLSSVFSFINSSTDLFTNASNVTLYNFASLTHFSISG